MENMVLSPVPLKELLSQFRAIVKEEIRAEQAQQQHEKLLSPAEAVKVFQPAISKLTLTKWTNDGLLVCQRIGGRIYYKQGDLLESAKTLSRYKAKKGAIL